MTKKEQLEMDWLRRENARLLKQIDEMHEPELSIITWSDVSMKDHGLPKNATIRFAVAPYKYISVRRDENGILISGSDCIHISPNAANSVNINL